MADKRLRLMLFGLLAFGTASLLAQEPIRQPQQSREPPLADEFEAAEAKGRFDPDEASRIERVQHVVPAGPTAPPRALPGELSGPESPAIIPAADTRTLMPVSDLPTPVVTLNIEGYDVSPSGQPVIYKLVVKNVSKAKAHNVVVKVTPPKNAEPVKRDPPPTHDEAESRWELKILEPGQTRTIELSYKPKADTDEIKLQARVQFDFGRGMITKVAAPSLGVKKEGPEKVVAGDTVTYRITVTNNGRVTVRDIEVKDLLNKGLVHDDRETARGSVDGRLMSTVDPQAGERMWTIAALAPGQSKVLEYRVRARDPGRIGSTVLLNAPDVKKQTGFDTEVLTAMLQVRADGPVNDKGTVGQSAGYRVVIENKGSADLKNVCVRCQFPPDMRPTKATNGGQPFRDTVQWTFPELRSGATKELNVGLATSTPGARTVQFAVKADKGAEQRAAVRTVFAGVPALSWDTDVPGTTSAGRNMVYKVTVSNTGSADAKATQLRVDLPDQVDFLSAAPDSARGAGQNAKMVIFPPYDIPAGKKTTFRIEVRARTAGEARVVFQLVGEGVGSEPAEHRKTTTITGTDNRSPGGPPPARPANKVDSSSIGALPKR